MKDINTLEAALSRLDALDNGRPKAKRKGKAKTASEPSESVTEAEEAPTPDEGTQSSKWGISRDRSDARQRVSKYQNLPFMDAIAELDDFERNDGWRQLASW